MRHLDAPGKLIVLFVITLVLLASGLAPRRVEAGWLPDNVTGNACPGDATSVQNHSYAMVKCAVSALCATLGVRKGSNGFVANVCSNVIEAVIARLVNDPEFTKWDICQSQALSVIASIIREELARRLQISADDERLSFLKVLGVIKKCGLHILAAAGALCCNTCRAVVESWEAWCSPDTIGSTPECAVSNHKCSDYYLPWLPGDDDDRFSRCAACCSQTDPGCSDKKSGCLWHNACIRSCGETIYGSMTMPQVQNRLIDCSAPPPPAVIPAGCPCNAPEATDVHFENGQVFCNVPSPGNLQLSVACLLGPKL